MKIERGDIFLAELDPTRGSEIQKTRPVIVVTNNIANSQSVLIAAIPLTSQGLDRVRVSEVLVAPVPGLDKKSKACIHQIRTLDRSRLMKKLGRVTGSTLTKINDALKIHLALP